MNTIRFENQTDILPVLQTKAETKAFYNKIAVIYDLLAEHSEQPMRNLGLAQLAPQLGERVLEIGFGTGHTLVKLAKAVGPEGSVYGVDLAENMVDAARVLLTREGLIDRVELSCGDAADVPCEDNSLDGVIMIFTLELLNRQDMGQVLTECRRVLRPDGRIVVVGISKEGRQGVVVRTFEWTHRHLPNLMDCRPIYVSRALVSAGFEIEHTSLEHMWVPVEIVLARNSKQEQR